MKVHVVDPAAYTPPYDHALCAALAAAGAEVDLYTSRFAYGAVAAPAGYARHEHFYRRARGPASSVVRRAIKLAEHGPDMWRYRGLAAAADVVHFQWLAVQHVDGHLLPAGRPLVVTAHDVLPREPRPGQLAAQRRLYDRFDAIVVHSEHGRRRLVGELGLAGERVHVIPHGAFAHLTAGAGHGAAVGAGARATGTGGALLPAELTGDRRGPVVLCFGLIRPYKGVEVLLEAWDGGWAAELWVVGMPRYDIAGLRAVAPANVRWVERFVGDDELAAVFGRADVVVLPYREADQSGVLATALAFGRAVVLSDVGGFAELGVGRLVAPGDAVGLRLALAELIGDAAAREDLAAAARAAAAGPLGWAAVARRTLDLYASLLG